MGEGLWLCVFRKREGWYGNPKYPSFLKTTLGPGMMGPPSASGKEGKTLDFLAEH